MADSRGSLLVEVDGIDLRNEAYNIATRTGRSTMPALRGDNLVLPGRDGALWAKNKPFDVGIGVLSMWVVGATPSTTGLVIPATLPLIQQAARDNMARLQRFFSRHHKLSKIRCAQPDGSIRYAWVEWKDWGEPTWTSNNTRAEWTIGFDIPDTFWADEVPTTQASVVGGALPQTLDLTSFTGMTGVINDAVLTVTGAITNPRITDSDTGNWVQYTGTLAANATWVIDVGNFTSVASGSSVMTNTTHGGGYRLLTIPNCYSTNDYPRLTLSGTGGGANTQLSVTANKKWVAA